MFFSNVWPMTDNSVPWCWFSHIWISSINTQYAAMVSHLSLYNSKLSSRSCRLMHPWIPLDIYFGWSISSGTSCWVPCLLCTCWCMPVDWSNGSWLVISKVSVAKDPVGATNSVIANKQGLNRAAGSGVFPLTVCLGLFYTPFYLFSLTQWGVQDFLQWNIPMMFLFGLVCSEDTHYDSHYWLTRRYQTVWYRRLVSARFKQYTQMIWYPLT